MAKTNYTKVEEILENGLRKMSIDQLFEESEKRPKKKERSTAEAGEPDAENLSPLSKAQLKVLTSLKRDLKHLQYKSHQEFYSSLGMKKSELRKKIENPQALTPVEWETILQIKKKIDVYKAQISTQIPELELNQTIEDERVKQLNKRFNVNEKWLPLH